MNSEGSSSVGFVSAGFISVGRRDLINASMSAPFDRSARPECHRQTGRYIAWRLSPPQISFNGGRWVTGFRPPYGNDRLYFHHSQPYIGSCAVAAKGELRPAGESTEP